MSVKKRPPRKAAAPTKNFHYDPQKRGNNKGKESNNQNFREKHFVASDMQR